jgi:hypothetical protein
LKNPYGTEEINVQEYSTSDKHERKARKITQEKEVIETGR